MEKNFLIYKLAVILGQSLQMTEIDKKLEILYDLLVDNFEILEKELKDLISKPDKIVNSNKFASLISVSTPKNQIGLN